MRVIEVVVDKTDWHLHFSSEKDFLEDDIDLRNAVSITVTTKMSVAEFMTWSFSQHNAYRIPAEGGTCPVCNLW